MHRRFPRISNLGQLRANFTNRLDYVGNEIGQLIPAEKPPST